MLQQKLYTMLTVFKCAELQKGEKHQIQTKKRLI